MFRELISRYGSEELSSSKVEAMILSSVIGLLANRRLLKAVRRHPNEERRWAREERGSALLATPDTSVLEVMLLPPRAAALGERLEALLLHEASNPNVKRLLLLERIMWRQAWTRWTLGDGSRIAEQDLAACSAGTTI